MAQKLDGQGKPFITLAQFLKLMDRARHGGAAKSLVRAGSITVNGESEERPGRKLHPGDVVGHAGETLTVAEEHVAG
jgi:ribosome-associated protein